MWLFGSQFRAGLHFYQMDVAGALAGCKGSCSAFTPLSVLIFTQTFSTLGREHRTMAVRVIMLVFHVHTIGNRI